MLWPKKAISSDTSTSGRVCRDLLYHQKMSHPTILSLSISECHQITTSVRTWNNQSSIVCSPSKLSNNVNWSHFPLKTYKIWSKSSLKSTKKYSSTRSGNCGSWTKLSSRRRCYVSEVRKWAGLSLYEMWERNLSIATDDLAFQSLSFQEASHQKISQ